MKKIEVCDMCGSKIVDGKCSCGTWSIAKESKDDPLKASLEMFHEMRQFTLLADMCDLGCAVVFFRGDFLDCKKVENFIYSMKGRPYYEE